MKAIIIFLALLAFSHGTPELKNAKNKPVPHFSLWERMLLKTIASTRPQLFQGVPVEEIFRTEAPTPKAYPEHLYIDAYLVEYRQLLTQAIKISKEANLPELDWIEHYDFCLWIWCFDFTLAQRSQDSRLIGTQSITSDSEVTPTSFKNTFKVPLFRWTSPNWYLNFTNNAYGDVVSYQGYHINAENVTITITSDYEYVDNIGIQLRNFDIDYTVGNLSTRLDAVYYVDGNGFVEKEGPYLEDLTEYTMDDWEYSRGKYTGHLVRQLNCLLSNSLSDPVACFPNDDKNYNAYYTFLMIQLMQTIGLGALLT